ncbi:ATP-dependent nuclease [Alcaligenes faecalis]|uniref:ATP-dependent nuclease n=1 Tax=Alcaligenes faecalis TaxID=511 RepID=UPI0024BCEF67|nr:ATP-dependent endonuclease [Alcaligenes faecalis]WHQ44361.1 ATP-dependent endonuclease [Alcaligenes faecalis]
MRIEKIAIENFRLLQSVEMSLERTTTLIVGRNNSGKTSITEFFVNVIGDEPKKLRHEDFSAARREAFLTAKQLRLEGKDENIVLAALPVITATVFVSYDPAEELGALAPFVIDLDPECKIAKISIEYRPVQTALALLLDPPVPEGGADDAAHLFKNLKEVVPKAYEYHVKAVDPNDSTNERIIELKQLGKLFQCGFVGAQRSLDQHKRGEPNVLGKLLEALFTTATSATATTTDQAIAAELKAAVSNIEQSIHEGFNEKLTALLPKIKSFGYPGLNDPDLRTETALNVVSLLSEHTKVFYTGAHGVHLPEGYNGLGARNLIYILLQLLSFHKSFRTNPTLPGVHVIFIEEPEAHLHPQMQEVFIKQLHTAVQVFSAEYPDQEWPVQFVITTHSSHIANAAPFDAVRYFLAKPSVDGALRHTVIKDFRKGADKIKEPDRDFLHRYLTLTKCDLFFADKAILIEGTTERLLMPRIIQLVDDVLDESKKLSQQYISTVEVDGANAKIFSPLLDFLELRALIITDLDSVKMGDKGRYVKCPYSQGERSLNTTLRDWFKIGDGEALTLEALKAKTPEEKVQGYRRVAYQIHEAGSEFCARTYEDAFILANPVLFELQEDGHWGDLSFNIAADMGKVETALKYGLSEDPWKVPAYISEGLLWLADSTSLPQPPADGGVVHVG